MNQNEFIDEKTSTMIAKKPILITVKKLVVNFRSKRVMIQKVT